MDLLKNSGGLKIPPIRLTMRYLCIFFVLLCGCKEKEPKQYNYELSDIQSRSDYYCEHSPEPRDLVDPGDLLTVKGIFDAFCRREDVEKHVYSPGFIHRDTKPVFPDYSRSECSVEAVLSWLVSRVERMDYVQIEDFWAYMEANDWICGEGPEKYTKMPQLRPLVKEILEKSGSIPKDQYEVLELASADSRVGYRGNVLALYIWVHGYSLKYIEGWHLAALKELASLVPQSPFYQSLVGCYDWSENYQIALNIMGDEERFPVDRLPEKVNEGLWDWSQFPQIPLYAMTRRVLEHCHE
jgi:hypothetical protein